MKAGDTVRYLNAVGGGKVTRVEGKVAYVDEDGFETPMLVKDLVVVMPADYDKGGKGANIMFDQKAFDAGKKKEAKVKAPEPEQPKEAAPLPPAPETDYGDKLTVTLAFEPSDIKKLSASTFNAVLVNDSNYYLQFVVSRQGYNDRRWSVVYSDTAGPNELIDLAQYSYDELPGIERVAIQAIAFKQGKDFELKAPVNVVKKLNLSKFYKLHCFRDNRFFDVPVIEVPLVEGDSLTMEPTEPDVEKLKEKLEGAKPKAEDRKGKAAPVKESPTKLLPPVEVDLNISGLLDTTAGMSAADILKYQLGVVEKTMESHRRRIGQKIIFIHGKGDGVLRKELISLLRKKYPKAEIQDASFREYGFGASLITIH